MKRYLTLNTSRYSLLALFALSSLNGHAESYSSATIATGFDYSSGRYGTANLTNILTIPVIGKYETEAWSFKLTVPYVRITTYGGVIPGIGPGPMNRASFTRATTQSGLGDVVAGATYYAIDGTESSPGLDITGKVKLPTADKNVGLGTGETDYFIQLDLYQSFKKLTLSGAVGRKYFGNSQAVPLNDVNYGSVGASYKLSDHVAAGLSLDVAQASSAAGANQQEVTAFISNKFEKNKKVQGYLLKGFADGSPDTGGGVLLTFIF